MDGLAFALTASGLFLANQGHGVVGAVLYILPLVLLAHALARRTVASVSLRQGVFVGGAVVYAACVALVERRVRYGLGARSPVAR